MLADKPRFRYYAARANKTQREIARSIGIEEVQISRWLRGVAQLAPEHVKAIADALGVSPLEILADSVEDPR